MTNTRKSQTVKAETMTMDGVFPIGTPVRFREGTAQFAQCGGIVYEVEASPSDKPFSVDVEGRRYQWLIEADPTNSKAPSKRRRRSGYVSALESA